VKKIKKKPFDSKELEYKIDIATQTLERNIGLIANCDNKTSIVLASIGALLAIILTNDGLSAIYNIIQSCLSVRSFCNICYLVCLFGSIFVTIFGMYKLGSVLVAKVSEDAPGRKSGNSKIFFSGIRKCGDCQTYLRRFYSMSKEDLLRDLVEQIYINADIASVKYAKYNVGLKCTISGFVSFVLILFIGIYLY
jgi:hypothetical protein